MTSPTADGQSRVLRSDECILFFGLVFRLERVKVFGRAPGRPSQTLIWGVPGFLSADRREDEPVAVLCVDCSAGLTLSRMVYLLRPGPFFLV